MSTVQVLEETVIVRNNIAAEMRKHFLDPKDLDYCVCRCWSDDEMSEDWDQHLADAILPIIAREVVTRRAEQREADAVIADSFGMISKRNLEPYWEGFDDAIDKAAQAIRYQEATK